MNFKLVCYQIYLLDQPGFNYGSFYIWVWMIHNFNPTVQLFLDPLHFWVPKEEKMDRAHLDICYIVLARPKLWRTRSIRGFHWWMIWECFGHQRYRHNYMYRHTEVCMCLWNFVGNNRLPLHCCVCIIIDIVGLANFNSCSDGPRSLSFFEKLISRLIVNICLCLSSSICGCLIQQIT
jgi:hypothetical protein